MAKGGGGGFYLLIHEKRYLKFETGHIHNWSLLHKFIAINMYIHIYSNLQHLSPHLLSNLY